MSLPRGRLYRCSYEARAFFVPIKDTRTFTVEPEYLLSDVIKDLEVGKKFS